MSFIVRWLKDGEAAVERRYDTLADAKRNARSQLPVHHLRRGATEAEVRDENGLLYLRVF